MSSSGPWSVKGIDPRARARAKTAARREGVTLGEWINRVILEDSDPAKAEWDDALEAFPGFGGASSLNEEDDRLLRAMVNRLTERVESSEQRSARTLTGLDKAISQLADKITRTSERTSAELAATQDSLGKVRKSQEDLTDRIRTLESTGPAGATDTAAVETTIMKLARRLYEHENDTAARLHSVDEDSRSIAESLEARLARLESRADDYAELDRKRQDRTIDNIGQLQSTTEALKAPNASPMKPPARWRAPCCAWTNACVTWRHAIPVTRSIWSVASSASRKMWRASSRIPAHRWPRLCPVQRQSRALTGWKTP